MSTGWHDGIVQREVDYVSLLIVLSVLDLKQGAPVTLEAVESVLLEKVQERFLKNFPGVPWL
jgi:hypothetical protein